jgi:glycosyltransferase involved in cell wall biosynthesis
MIEWPFVSVIMPIRNEADFIQKAIESVLQNDYPHDRLEILVVDGMSDDGTRRIVTDIANRDSRVLMLDNPKKIVPYAMNIGLRQIKGDLFARVDGHATVAPDFLSSSVKCLLETRGAWLVGGYIETTSDTFIGKAISAAMQSAVGVGNAMFRRGDYEGWVDTLAFGMHHRWILDKIGFFDEELVRNQDDDFNFRVIQAGGKIWLSKNIKSTYYSRSSLKKLWRQYFQYGFWRIRTIQKHGQPATLRQLAPMLLVLSLLGFGILSFVHPLFGWLLAAELSVYALGLVAGMIDVGRKSFFKYTVIAPLIFTILHFGYGIGSLWGIVRFLLLQGQGIAKPEEHKLSR